MNVLHVVISDHQCPIPKTIPSEYSLSIFVIVILTYEKLCIKF